MSNFWRSLDLLLTNCEIEIDLSWSKECVISEISITPTIAGNLPNSARQTTRVRFQINNVKLYVPVLTLSIYDDIKFLQNINQRFKIIISWNKYRLEIITQLQNNNLYYLIDPNFRNINRLFVLLFKNGNDDPTRNSFDKYYMPLVEIKDFNALFDNKLFSDQPGKKKQETYEKRIEMSRNDDYTTRNLFDYLYHLKYCKLIGIDLSRQINMNIHQQISFTEKLEEDDGWTMFAIVEKQQKNILKFSLDSLIVTE